MGMVVRTNMAALGANNSLAQASKAQQNGMQKLYTGFKINAAKDDASGLAISEKMKNQIKALDTAKDNCEDGANMIQTAEGYMKETHDILTRMTELSEKAANGLLKDEDRNALQNEMDQLCGEIDRMASTANFNGVKLLDGSLGSSGQVKIKSVATDKSYEYVAPKAEGVEKSTYGGGALINSTAKSGKYQVTEIINDNAGAAPKIKANLVKEDGTLGDEKEFTVKPQKGDTVTLDTDGKGITSGGLSLTSTTADDKGCSFTFNGTNWINDADAAGAKTMTIVTQSARGLVGDTFDFKADADGDDAKGVKLQIGESSTTADRMNVSINSFHTDSLFGGLGGTINKSLDLSSATINTAAVKIKDSNDASTYTNAVSIDITDKDAASAAADAIRQVSNYISDERGKLGAQQNRLDHTVNNLATASENTTAAKSRILDTDMAKEMMEYTSKNVARLFTV